MWQVYRPLEFLFTVAAFTTLIENFLPQLIALPKVGANSRLACRLCCARDCVCCYRDASTHESCSAESPSAAVSICLIVLICQRHLDARGVDAQFVSPAAGPRLAAAASGPTAAAEAGNKDCGRAQSSAAWLQALIQSFVRSTLTLTFVIAAARVVFNIKVGSLLTHTVLCLITGT